MHHFTLQGTSSLGDKMSQHMSSLPGGGNEGLVGSEFAGPRCCTVKGQTGKAELSGNGAGLDWW